MASSCLSMLHAPQVDAAAMRRSMERASRSVVWRVLHDLTICGRDARAPKVMPIAARVVSIAGFGDDYIGVWSRL